MKALPREGALAALEQLYRRLDADLDRVGPRCERSGRCCDFPTSSLTLFATQLEIDHLLEQVGAPPRPQRDGWCPWYRERLCVAREGRPLGCRVYFCDERVAGELERLSASYHEQLRRLHDESGRAYHYAPFLELVAQRGSREDGETLSDGAGPAR